MAESSDPDRDTAPGVATQGEALKDQTCVYVDNNSGPFHGEYSWGGSTTGGGWTGTYLPYFKKDLFNGRPVFTQRYAWAGKTPPGQIYPGWSPNHLYYDGGEWRLGEWKATQHDLDFALGNEGGSEVGWYYLIICFLLLLTPTDSIAPQQPGKGQSGQEQ